MDSTKDFESGKMVNHNHDIRTLKNLNKINEKLSAVDADGFLVKDSTDNKMKVIPYSTAKGLFGGSDADRYLDGGEPDSIHGGIPNVDGGEI